MIYFTSDWHIDDHRLDLLIRKYDSVDEMNVAILRGLGDEFKLNPPTRVYMLGDVMYPIASTCWIMELFRVLYPECEFVLIVGNHDENKLDVLRPYFDEVHQSLIIDIDGLTVYLNHYPLSCKDVLQRDPTIDFAITGHIHGHWRCQPKMINVGIDAWALRPVSIDMIQFYWNAMVNHYDGNVFPYKK